MGSAVSQQTIPAPHPRAACSRGIPRPFSSRRSIELAGCHSGRPDRSQSTVCPVIRDRRRRMHHGPQQMTVTSTLPIPQRLADRVCGHLPLITAPPVPRSPDFDRSEEHADANRGVHPWSRSHSTGMRFEAASTEFAGCFRMLGAETCKLSPVPLISLSVLAERDTWPARARFTHCSTSTCAGPKLRRRLRYARPSRCSSQGINPCGMPSDELAHAAPSDEILSARDHAWTLSEKPCDLARSAGRT